MADNWQCCGGLRQCHGSAIAVPWWHHGTVLQRMALPWHCHGTAMAMRITPISSSPSVHARTHLYDLRHHAHIMSCVSVPGSCVLYPRPYIQDLGSSTMTEAWVRGRAIHITDAGARTGWAVHHTDASVREEGGVTLHKLGYNREWECHVACLQWGQYQQSKMCV